MQIVSEKGFGISYKLSPGDNLHKMKKKKKKKKKKILEKKS